MSTLATSTAARSVLAGLAAIFTAFGGRARTAGMSTFAGSIRIHVFSYQSSHRSAAAGQEVNDLNSEGHQQEQMDQTAGDV